MRIRSQIAAVFVLFAVLPLLGLVLMTYRSSSQAVEEAIRADADALTDEMQRRLGDLRAGLEGGVERVGPELLSSFMGKEDGDPDRDHDSQLGGMIAELGDRAELIESFEIEAEEGAEAGDNGEEGRSFTVAMEELARLARRGELAEIGGTSAFGELAAPVIRFGLGVASDVLGDETVEELVAESVPRPGESAGERAAREARVVALKRRIEERVERVADRQAKHWEIIALRRSRDARADRPPPPFPAPSPVPAPEAVPGVSSTAPAPPAPGLGFDVERLVRDPEGRVLGRVRPRLDGAAVLRRVMADLDRGRGEIPFARDAEGRLYVLDDADRPVLEELVEHLEPVAQEPAGEDTPAAGASSPLIAGDWVVVQSQPEPGGLVFGIASPTGEPLAAVREAATRNLLWGLGLIAVALLGVMPLSRRLTRNLDRVTAGVERLATGDLEAEVPVRSKDEVGVLAATFNRMAGELRSNQARLVETELHQRLLEVELARKDEELEAARQFQLSMLPKELPRHPAFEVAVEMRTATEVGGDYYDFHLEEGATAGEIGALTIAVGDATGHGATAGRMVTVVKSLLTSRGAAGGIADLAVFLDEANRTIKRMELGRMAMAMSLVRLEPRRLTLAAAGMPPVLVYRAASGAVDEVTIAGPPLGSLDYEYGEKQVPLAEGDVVLMMSDGFPELPDAEGEPLGYREARDLFAAAAAEDGPPADIVAALLEAAADHTGGAPPADDVTFLAVRVR